MRMFLAKGAFTLKIHRKQNYSQTFIAESATNSTVLNCLYDAAQSNAMNRDFVERTQNNIS